MADLTTTIGLSDREFRRGLRDVQREVGRTRGTIQRESAGMSQSIGRTATRLAGAYVTIEAVNRGVRYAGRAAQEYRQQNDYLDGSINTLDSSVRRFNQSLGRDLALAMSTTNAQGANLVDTLSELRVQTTNFLADLFSHPGHAAAVDAANIMFERQQRGLKRVLDLRSRISRFDEQESRYRGNSINADRISANRELQEGIIEVGRRERVAIEDGQYIDFDPERSAIERVHAARLADISRRASDLRRRDRLERRLTEAEAAGDRRGAYASRQNIGLDDARTAARRRGEELGESEAEIRARQTRAEAAFAATRRRREAENENTYRDRFDTMRAQTLDTRGNSAAAERIREQAEVRRMAEEIRADELLTEERKNELIAEGTRLIREQYAARRGGSGRTLDPGLSFLAPQVFGRRPPSRHEATELDPIGRRESRRILARAARLDRTGGVDRRVYDEEGQSPAARFARESAQAVYGDQTQARTTGTDAGAKTLAEMHVILQRMAENVAQVTRG